MIQPRRLTTALLSALVISSGCTYLLSRRMDSQAIAKRKETVLYAAPAHSIKSGEVIKPADMQLLAWPASSPIKGAYAKVDEVVGRAALYPLEPGQPVTDKEISAPGAGIGLASRIPNGMRAIALKSDEVVGVAGFLNPGSHVDVLVTYRSERQMESITATVLQNAEVIAAGHQVEPDPEGKAPTTPATVVTLLLTPQQAERALLASNQGSIHFVLRNSGDTSSTDNTSVALSQLIGGGYTSIPTVSMPTTLAPLISPAGAPKKALSAKVATVAVAKPYQVETVLGGQQAAAFGAERTQP